MMFCCFSHGAPRRRGSIFIETMVALAIVGVAIAALMEFVGTSTRAHAYVLEQQRAADYAGAAIEYCSNQSFASLSACQTTPWRFSPPKNAQGVDFPAADSPGWTQVVRASKVPEDDLDGAATSSTVLTSLWVTVTIEHNGRSVYSEGRIYMQDR